MNFEIDRAQWSRSSRNSSGGHYDAKATSYEGIAYSCRKCGSPEVFGAHEQKMAYEVQKKFVWWQPSLCPKCREELNLLRELDREYQNLWNNDKEKLKAQKVFLKKWLLILREIQEYGKRTNESMVVCLVRLINET